MNVDQQKREADARRVLAKRWHCSQDQIIDAEVAWFLGEPIPPPVACLTRVSQARKP